MNQENLDFLSRQILFTGFGEGHAENLKAKIESGVPDFTLAHQQNFGKDEAVAALHFHRPEGTDRYYFNNYSLVLKAGENDPIKQTFYINAKQDNITFKEGYNLLSGRAVKKTIAPKEGEKYQAWLQLDQKTMDDNGRFKVKQFHPNYGFDLEAAVHKHPIQELKTNEGTKRLMESLERGNRQQVTTGVGHQEGKIFIEAAPQFKTLNVYDANQNLIKSPTNKLGQPETQKLLPAPDISKSVNSQQVPGASMEKKTETEQSAKQEVKPKIKDEEKPAVSKRPRQKLR